MIISKKMALKAAKLKEGDTFTHHKQEFIITKVIKLPTITRTFFTTTQLEQPLETTVNFSMSFGKNAKYCVGIYNNEMMVAVR
jgi:hypothetical protein